MKNLILALAIASAVLVSAPVAQAARPVTCNLTATNKIFYGAQVVFDWTSTGATSGFVFTVPTSPVRQFIIPVNVSNGTSGYVSRAIGPSKDYYFVFFNDTNAAVCSARVEKKDI